MADLSKYCRGLSELKQLVLRDGCFRIEHKSNELVEWCCFENIATPLDGFEKILTTIGPGADYVIFDNQFDGESPSPPYENKLIVRGVMLYFFYDEKDENGEDVADADKTIGLGLTDYAGNNFVMPIYESYMAIWNPVTDKKSQLINKLEVINDNNFDVTVSGLVILGDRNGVTLEGAGPGC